MTMTIMYTITITITITTKTVITKIQNDQWANKALHLMIMTTMIMIIVIVNWTSVMHKPVNIRVTGAILCITVYITASSRFALTMARRVKTSSYRYRVSPPLSTHFSTCLPHKLPASHFWCFRPMSLWCRLAQMGRYGCESDANVLKMANNVNSNSNMYSCLSRRITRPHYRQMPWPVWWSVV